ncbi:phage head-tail connector protein [Miniphocaeibacter massiliensis]|uniref:phage head-tail connector protein n=1 Tax=Miniphocaeibacter massiliensis TaxID=2041841 RepID=UPI000C1B9003|nr:phage head-tail connector protein [Miniphocaeibacter massiliensis]
MNQIGERIKVLLGDVDENQVNVLVELVESQLVNKLKVYNEEIKAIPLCLEYIVVETVIARFNYLGSEGMSSESVEGHSMSFYENYLNRFDDDIKLWAEVEGLTDNGKGKVMFL